MSRERKRNTVQVKSEITKEECDRLDHIIEKFAFKSRYQVIQYLVKSFLKVADPIIDEDEPDEEIEKMFDGFESAGSENLPNVKRGSAI